MSSNPPSQQHATVIELAAAIQQLTDAERRRLDRKARVLAFGTEYAEGQELLNEAVKRALIGASNTPKPGERGRPWPKNVHIVAFLSMTMQSIANGSHHSVRQRVDRKMEAISGDDGESNDRLHEFDLYTPGVDEELITQQESQTQQAIVDADVAAIEAHFAQDDDVSSILEGEKEDMSPAEVREMFDMTKTQYDTARRRMRRGIDKLMPGRRQK